MASTSMSPPFVFQVAALLNRMSASVITCPGPRTRAVTARQPPVQPLLVPHETLLMPSVEKPALVVPASPRAKAAGETLVHEPIAFVSAPATPALLPWLPVFSRNEMDGVVQCANPVALSQVTRDPNDVRPTSVFWIMRYAPASEAQRDVAAARAASRIQQEIRIIVPSPGS